MRYVLVLDIQRVVVRVIEKRGDVPG